MGKPLRRELQPDPGNPPGRGAGELDERPDRRGRRLAFVFDIVLNHIEANSPLHLMHGPPETNPYFVPFEGFNWGFPKLDQENEAFKLFVRDTLRHWIEQWGVDGYRYDATQWIQWSGWDYSKRSRANP